MTIHGKVALVTGGSRGIGRAIALRLAQEGADTAINFFTSMDEAEETAKSVEALGRKAHLIRANVAEPESIQYMFDEINQVFGGLDILINNAASGVLRPSLELNVRHWEWTMNVNARALLLCAQKATPLMQARGGGRIVSITSLGSSRVIPDYAIVGASKAALESLTRYLAAELAPLGILVNAVAGGLVDTDALKAFPRRRQMLALTEERTPTGRLLQPEDIAHCVAFLCSDKATMICGQIIVVDGGYSLMG
jgi:enoyl-[acyl-carrier protein] reductase III